MFPMVVFNCTVTTQNGSMDVLVYIFTYQSEPAVIQILQLPVIAGLLGVIAAVDVGGIIASVIRMVVPLN